MVMLPDILVYRCGRTKRIIIVAGRDDKIRIPAIDQVRNILLALTVSSVIAYHTEADHSSWNRCNRGRWCASERGC